MKNTKKKLTWADFKEKVNYFMFGPYLEKDEKILNVARRHIFVLVIDIAKIAVFEFFVPVFLWYVFPELWFVWTIWMLHGFLNLDKVIFAWFFDVILITDLSLLDLKWRGFFDKESVRLEYANIEGTSYNFKGVLQTVFNFGTLQVNRQGGGVGLELLDAVSPAKIESTIMLYQEKYMSDKNFEDVNSLKNLLSEMIKKHAKEMKEIEVDY